MIFRTYDKTFLEAVINHPSVRPTAQGGAYRLTADNIFANRHNLVFGSDAGGAVVFVEKGSFVYAGHIFCIEGARGAAAMALGRAAMARLFDNYFAQKLVASVPLALPAARVLCRRLGLHSVGRDLFEEHFELEAE